MTYKQPEQITRNKNEWNVIYFSDIAQGNLYDQFQIEHWILDHDWIMVLLKRHSVEFQKRSIKIDVDPLKIHQRNYILIYWIATRNCSMEITNFRFENGKAIDTRIWYIRIHNDKYGKKHSEFVLIDLRDKSNKKYRFVIDRWMERDKKKFYKQNISFLNDFYIVCIHHSLYTIIRTNHSWKQCSPIITTAKWNRVLGKHRVLNRSVQNFRFSKNCVVLL